MEYSYDLTQKYNTSELWTRARAAGIRTDVLAQSADLQEGDILSLNAAKVEVFDFSFAAELFGELIRLFQIRRGQFLVIDDLNEYNQINLQQALESLGLAIIIRNDGTARLIGDVAQVDAETFAVVAATELSISSAEVQQSLGVSLNATNERLKKLVGMNLIRRVQGRSSVGRTQYLYCTLQ